MRGIGVGEISRGIKREPRKWGIMGRNGESKKWSETNVEIGKWNK